YFTLELTWEYSLLWRKPYLYGFFLALFVYNRKYVSHFCVIIILIIEVGRIFRMTKRVNPIQVRDVIIANQVLKDVVVKTRLQLDPILSEKYECNVYLKREDLQVVRSFKIRGAYHFMHSLSKEELKNGV